MKKVLWILVAVGIGLVAAAALLADQDADKAEQKAAVKAAENAADSWLALVDSGQYGKSWSEAAALFRRQLSTEQWEKAASQVRESVGKRRSRNLKSGEVSRTLPGAPDGEYVVLQYDSSFENKKEAVETVVPMKDKDGVWRVSGYFIK